MSPITQATTLQFIQSAYETFDRLNMSLEMVAAIAIILVVTFLLAMRELAAWFFKINDLKADLRTLEVSISRLEHEITTLQQQRAMITPTIAVVEKAPQGNLRRPEQFPINH